MSVLEKCSCLREIHPKLACRGHSPLGLSVTVSIMAGKKANGVRGAAVTSQCSRAPCAQVALRHPLGSRKQPHRLSLVLPHHRWAGAQPTFLRGCPAHHPTDSPVGIALRGCRHLCLILTHEKGKSSGQKPPGFISSDLFPFVVTAICQICW